MQNGLKSDYFRIEMDFTGGAVIESEELKSDYFRIEILKNHIYEDL